MSVAKQLRFSRRTVDVAPAGAGDGASPKLNLWCTCFGCGYSQG